ncbi:site-specific DNA-methyltransferase [Microbacterium betulae]|uniref:Methyltransferase n=1 Tax=Microbacterium betulae TaxID=2981139 RepID=A0AA97FJ59_9MICO|nr:site-specific DNA-methyltransferase [Microbacterium sp. AB]WOF23659.1 site-specific DNA-methyltransferase [Microbacterium sp. AB]
MFTDDQKVYTTPWGTQLHGDSLELLKGLEDESIDLIVTSPPFALQRKKAYGNEEQEAYVDWLAQFGEAAKRVLKDTGSLVIDIGNAYRKGSPTRSLYPYRVLLKFVDELEYHLAEEFFWYNPAKLPSPLEWVNKRRIRVKDAVNTVWWFSKTEWPQADVNRVLQPYSKNMEKLLKDPEKYYKTSLRPSEHDISKHFGNDNGGAIPSNLLQISNTESNTNYLRLCRELEIKSHPARFPNDLPKFFIEFLTSPGDVVVDIFSGSNTTGMVAEQLGRKWYSFELNRDYAALSIMRFLPSMPAKAALSLYERARRKTVSLPSEARGLIPIAIQSAEKEFRLAEKELHAAGVQREKEFEHVRAIEHRAEMERVDPVDNSSDIIAALQRAGEEAALAMARQSVAMKRIKTQAKALATARAAAAALDSFYGPAGVEVPDGHLG